MKNLTQVIAGVLAACPIAAFVYIEDYRFATVVSVTVVAIAGYLLFGYSRGKT